MECVNLREEFGDRYRLFFDASVPVSGPGRDTGRRDPWMMCLRTGSRNGRFVELYPGGGGRLRVDVDYRGPTVSRLLAIEGVELVQDGDREKTLEFDVGLFGDVDAVLKFRRKRQLSDEERARLRAQILAVRAEG